MLRTIRRLDLVTNGELAAERAENPWNLTQDLEDEVT
jgi:hypothetical protein